MIIIELNIVQSYAVANNARACGEWKFTESEREKDNFETKIWYLEKDLKQNKKTNIYFVAKNIFYFYTTEVLFYYIWYPATSYNFDLIGRPVTNNSSPMIFSNLIN